MTTWGTVVPAAPGAKPPEEPAKPNIPAWSYSRLAKWEQCPRSAYYAFILKVPEPKSPQMARGTLAHMHAALILEGLSDSVPPDTPLTPAWINLLRDTHATYKEDVETELQMAFTQNWNQTKWFAPDAWCRVIYDALIVTPGESVLVKEHKTGKPRGEHLAQASLYAAGVAALVPGVDVEVTLNYLDLDPIKPGGMVRHFFSAKSAKDHQVMWAKRVAPMLADTEYPANTGNHCRWCAFAKSKGGPCDRA